MSRRFALLQLLEHVLIQLPPGLWQRNAGLGDVGRPEAATLGLGGVIESLGSEFCWYRKAPGTGELRPNNIVKVLAWARTSARAWSRLV